MKNVFLTGRQGFSLIELLVVFAIIALILGVAVPGFTNYNRSQVLKTAAFDLKSILREAQNASLQGKKEGPCTASDTLIGHFITFNDGAISYDYGISCGLLDPYTIASYDFSHNDSVYIDDIKDSAENSKSPVTVMFGPVNEGVRFIDGPPSGGINMNVDYLKIILSNGVRGHAVYISSSGDIYEERVED